jgi:short-subunit dehydrogenase
MNLGTAIVLLTGATGGIGHATAEQLLRRGARVLMTGRNVVKLQSLQQELAAGSDRIGIVAADLTQQADRRSLVAHATRWHGGVNVLVNNAGTSDFQGIENHSCEQIAALIATNLTAPLQLSRELLPHLRRQSKAHILNVGSVYGTIGYPGFAVYCATKFGMRGFTEALRRELTDTSVRVHYLAPRATRTGMNDVAVDAMNEHLQVAVDPPARVARAVCRMLEREQRELVIGWPEKLFARINAILPQVVDGAVRKQLPTIRHYIDAPPLSGATHPSSDTARTTT